MHVRLGGLLLIHDYQRNMDTLYYTLKTKGQSKQWVFEDEWALKKANTVKWARKKTSSFKKKRLFLFKVELLPHPPYSPDFRPSNFLFPSLKKMAQQKTTYYLSNDLKK